MNRQTKKTLIYETVQNSSAFIGRIIINGLGLATFWFIFKSSSSNQLQYSQPDEGLRINRNAAYFIKILLKTCESY